jgi:hypothetical protein
MLRYPAIAAATSPGLTSSPRSTIDRRLSRGEELGYDFAVLALTYDRVVDVVAALDEHAPDEVAELGKRLDRRGLELRLQGLELALPLVAVEAGLGHGHTANLLAPAPLQTRSEHQ